MSKPLKVWGSLSAEVVNAGMCMYCGTCIASCPVNVLQPSDEQKPVIKGICVLCQLCYYGCPRVDLPRADIEKAVFGRIRTEDEKDIGIIQEAYFARSNDKEIASRCQDSGIASVLLVQALEDRLIDIALTTKTTPEDLWKPAPALAFDRSQVLEATGSKYNVAASVSVLADAVTGYPESRIGYVGVPCQIEGIRKITHAAYSNRKLGEHVKLTIGIFCFNSFLYKNLMLDCLQEQNHVDLRNVTRFDIRNNVFTAYRKKEKLFEAAIPDLKEYRLPGCSKCQDFTGELADISVGAADASKGWSTVLVRTDTGRALFRSACEKSSIEYKPVKRIKLGLKTALKLSERKKLRPAPYLKL